VQKILVLPLVSGAQSRMAVQRAMSCLRQRDGVVVSFVTCRLGGAAASKTQKIITNTISYDDNGNMARMLKYLSRNSTSGGYGVEELRDMSARY
jgi:hypothetical protein